VIYLYAITDAPAAPSDCYGLEQAHLSSLTHGPLTAVYSRHEQLELRAEFEMIWRHEQVVERLMQQVAVLPARFGSVFDDLASLASSLAGSETRLCGQLDRVRGRVELAVRVRAPSPAVRAGAHSGRDYLEDRLAAHRWQASVAQCTLVPLRLLAADQRVAPAREAGVLAASYLVDSGDVDRFAHEVRVLQHSNEGLTLSCTGPWAPYSFVGGEGA
jgi:hypothetical protein